VHTALIRGRRVPVVVWVGLAAFVGLGLPEATLGVTWPSIRADLDLPLSALGLLLGSLTIGYLPTSAVSGRLTARFGAGVMLSAAAAIFAAAMTLYLTAPSLPFLITGSVLGGVAAGITDPGINTHFALHHGTRTMNLLHASFGIGATAGPFVATTVIGGGGSWRIPYGIYLVVQLALMTAFLSTRRRWAATVPTTETTETVELVAPVTDPGTDGAPARVAHPRAVTFLSAATFLVYTGLEVGGGVLAFTLLAEGRGLSATAAGLWATSYWAGLTVGRAALGFGGARLTPEQIVRVSSLAAVGAAVLITVDPAGWGSVGFPLLGLSVAGIFPSLVLLTPKRVGRERTPNIIGVQFALAAIGASGLPALIALVAEHDLERIGLGLVVLAVAVAALDLAVTRLGQRPPTMA
jgi:fucose permease